MKLKNNKLFFDNDDEFYDYAVNPTLITKSFIDKNNIERCYYDFDFTNQYYNDIDNNISFIIKDKNSLINKRKGVSYKTIFKEIQNLEPWDEWDDDEDDEN